MSQILILQATVNDIPVVKNLAKQTFSETFAESNTEENMANYLDKNFTDDKFLSEMSNPDSQFFIAWDGNTAVGYLKVNSGYAQTELQEESALEIERIYVLAGYHGQKVGQLLYEKALEIAETSGKTSIWLGVWEENPRAIRFYEKNGFIPFDKHIFRMGNDEQIDIMMRKVL